MPTHDDFDNTSVASDWTKYGLGLEIFQLSGGGSIGPWIDDFRNEDDLARQVELFRYVDLC
jgi:hypothetical protein